MNLLLKLGYYDICCSYSFLFSNGDYKLRIGFCLFNMLIFRMEIDVNWENRVFKCFIILKFRKKGISLVLE